MSMDDKDRVFARFKDGKPTSANRRETLTIPRRAGTPGTRSVEVVHVSSGGAVRDRAQRQDLNVRAASWDGGFPTKQTALDSVPIEPAAPEVAELVTHVMPAWEPAVAQAEAPPAEEPHVALRRGRGRPRKQPASDAAQATDDAARIEDPVAAPSHDGGQPAHQKVSPPSRRFADPFDASDDGANCRRCGYAVEPAREKRGLLTCLACG